VQLARCCTVEEVAALLWTGSRRVPEGWFDEPPAEVRLRENVGPLAALQIELALAEAEDPTAHDVRPERVARTGARVLRRLARVAGGGGGADGNISELLQRAWVPHRPEAEPLLRSALILLADHELNVASFTARCVASAGSTPYAAVSAGIGAMHGVRHARHVERVEALFAEVDRPERARQVLEARLRRGERVPGFGHRLHPSGDPRATELLRRLRDVDPHSPGLALADAVVAAAEPVLEDRPTFEIGLVAVARAMELPAGAPLMLFVLGRSLGLVAHAVEQYASREVLRPRARYTGVMPPAE
jgi:citrate synthase